MCPDKRRRLPRKQGLQGVHGTVGRRGGGVGRFWRLHTHPHDPPCWDDHCAPARAYRRRMYLPSSATVFAQQPSQTWKSSPPLRPPGLVWAGVYNTPKPSPPLVPFCAYPFPPWCDPRPSGNRVAQLCAHIPFNAIVPRRRQIINVDRVGGIGLRRAAARRRRPPRQLHRSHQGFRNPWLS